MSQPISTLMQREVASVSPDATMQTVEALMVARGLSWVPVLEGGGAVLGVISSTDLLRFHADGKDPASVCAWQICTYKPIVVRPDTPLGEVARLMVESNVHHVVVAEGADFKGVVSSFDFVRTFMA
ncbi:MAG: CBS domain-containing protein [Pseudomonadota bacterium]|nr:CBS domain-containing protein [Pseudomonadota bacterium]